MAPLCPLGCLLGPEQPPVLLHCLVPWLGRREGWARWGGMLCRCHSIGSVGALHAVPQEGGTGLPASSEQSHQVFPTGLELAKHLFHQHLSGKLSHSTSPDTVWPARRESGGRWLMAQLQRPASSSACPLAMTVVEPKPAFPASKPHSKFLNSVHSEPQ